VRSWPCPTGKAAAPSLAGHRLSRDISKLWLFSWKSKSSGIHQSFPAGIPVSNYPSFQQTSTIMQREAAANRYAGVTIAAHAGQIIFEEAAGFSIRSAKLPINRDTRFQLASTGKLFTIIAVAQLLESATVTLDDSLTKWLPEFSGRERWSKVTVRHLLGHTSGFGTYWGERFVQKRTSLRSVQDHFVLFEDSEPAFEPGSKFEYSNVGYILLGAIIERATHSDYFEYIQSRVFQPAGMHDSGYYEADEDIPNLALGYTFRDLPEGSRGRVPARLHSHLKPMRGSPAGDAVSTAPDLVRMCQALLAGKLVGRPVLEQLWLPAHLGPSPPGSSAVYRMGLGFMSIHSRFGNPVGHTGGFAGTTTSVFMDPQSSLVAVALASVDREEAAPISLSFADAWLKHDFRSQTDAG
jgi:CubicO group peptidase (beta-lactamase class C family)